MSLIELSIPLASFERLVKGIERIADACDRAFPSPLTEDDPVFKEPESGLTVVTDEMLLEEQIRGELRARGFKPDDIEAMINETETTAQ